jgi:outer membrane protein assembly factor BamB
VDIRTGKDIWKEGGFGPGQVILVGDKVVATSDKGEVVVAAANHEKYSEVARKDVLEGKVWSYPVLAGGKIYARSTSEGVCLDVN